MLTQLMTAAIRGVDAYPVWVEVHVANGLPSFHVVGLPQGEVREGRERVTAALQNAGFPVPHRRITVNLAPADVRKEGSAFDLPIALGLVAATGGLSPGCLEGLGFIGELGLDGSLRPLKGALPVAAVFRREGFSRLVLPLVNAREAASVRGLDVYGVASVTEAIAFLRGESTLRPTPACEPEASRQAAHAGLALEDVAGQESAKRALEVSAAGGHNVLLVGAPGVGKTMLARRLPGILPPMEVEEALEVTSVHSVAGLLSEGTGLMGERPFRAPHHTVSYAGLVGGGNPPGPGEASLAHHGVLFLDELPEFRRNALEALRQPLEDGAVTIARARSRLRFPARFILVGAMNPCRCGYHGDGTDRCACDPAHVERYRARISGPLMDRVDLHVEVPGVRSAELAAGTSGPTSAETRARVEWARRVQRERLRGVDGVYCNGQMRVDEIRRFCRPGPAVTRLLQRALDRLRLSARSYHRILKVARTLADLEAAEGIELRHAAEAIQYRALDRG